MAASPSGRLLALSDRCYRALLAAYPPAFRAAYGPWLAQIFRDCCRDALRARGIFGLLVVWRRALLDLARTAPVERALATRENTAASIAEGGKVMGESGALGRLRTRCSRDASPATVMLVAATVWATTILIAAVALRDTTRAGLVLDMLGGGTPLYIVLLGALLYPRRMDLRAALAGVAIVWGMVAVGAFSVVVLRGALEGGLARDLLIGGLVSTVVLLLLAGYMGYAGRARR